MAYPWTAVGTVFNARYGLSSEKEVDGVCNAPKEGNFQPYVDKKLLQEHPTS